MVSSAPGKASETWALRSRRIVTPVGEIDGAVLVRGETIVDVDDKVPTGVRVVDVGDLAVLPGLVDTHVHINEPGRTEWEGFETATRAAAAGGITTLVDMPLNSSPVTTTVAAFEEKLAASDGKLFVDVGFYGGVVPGNGDQIAPLARAGVLGFKAFLCHSGIDDFPAATEADVRNAVAHAGGLPLLAHAEIVAPLPAEVVGRLTKSPGSYAAYLASRPRDWEHEAIAMLIAVCRETGRRVHVVHLASADALPMIAEARAAGLPLTVETCPHYLYFAAEEIPDRDTRYKCAPPIRERSHRERLWKALGDGLIDTIGSDHSPAPPGMKQLDSGDLSTAWGGIASLQVSLAAVWTRAREHGLTLTQVAEWMSRNPAKLVGLAGKKGAIAAGHDADLVVFDPDAEQTIAGTSLHHRHKATPYDGQRLRGRVVTTYLRGQAVGEKPEGRTIIRGR
jgi:allantoinase